MKEQFQIALLQSDIHWENIEANLAMFEEKIWQVTGDPDLILLPEMFSTGFSMNPQKLAEPVNSKTLRWMQQLAAQTKAVIGGSYIVREGTTFFNRFYAVYPDGRSFHYDKKHLFGLAGEANDYAPGEKRVIFEVAGWRIMPIICYDLRFPVWIRSQKQPSALYEYDLLICVANWPVPRVNAWDTLLAARAIENLSYCAGVNRLGRDGVDAGYSGHSAIYNYKGDRMDYAEEETVVQASLSREALVQFRERFPFQGDADPFTLDYF